VYGSQKKLAAALSMSEPALTRLKAKLIADKRMGHEEWKSYLDTARESGLDIVPDEQGPGRF
jgi:hypothetical protein